MRYWIILLSLFLISTESNSQNLLSTQGAQIVDEAGNEVILRGMGLGGWMLQEGYMLQTASFADPEWEIREHIEDLIGAADTEIFYDAWLANHVQKVDIDSLKSWGFNSVRLPMHYKLFTLPIEQEPVAFENTWLDKGFILTDSLISWCAQNDMWVILDLHGAPGGQGYNAGISDYNPAFPSLWESDENKAKTVALWKRLAERYKDEQWVAGYDLLNETNWDLPGGIALKNLYVEIIDSIRTVDTDHIIFIEGNWFANDFTGLTPPFDNNMVYSPHKYWSYNKTADIQWVLSIRSAYNVPLYFGESGENSNPWFRDAIKLFEDNGIGWAWWPMKKIESISCPTSVHKSFGYQTLLNYWEFGGAPPAPAFAMDALMGLTENLKMENCEFNKDIIDAMFRQVQSDETIPYAIHTVPGVIAATDFDMGIIGEAYWDETEATYHVNTGEFTAWNEGWQYRNDAVGCEFSEDQVNSNGYNVGFINANEWLQYEVTVNAEALYNVNVRVAATSAGETFRLQSGEAAISPAIEVPNTGGFQAWQTVIVPNVYLRPEDKYFRFYSIGEGYNIGSFEFIEVGASTDINMLFSYAQTSGNNNMVKLDLNKPIVDPLPNLPAGFEITVDGSPVPILDMQIDSNNDRTIFFTVDHFFLATEDIRISYNGSALSAVDATSLDSFTLEEVQNNAPQLLAIPGLVQAEAYETHEGIQLETTTDIGGGQNIGFLDVGDQADYLVYVNQAGTYQVKYRTASQSAGGGLSLYLVNEYGMTSLLHTLSFPSTGGWQTWTDTEASVSLPEGPQKLRIVITESLFNVNWIDFSLPTSIAMHDYAQINIFPNPSRGSVFIQSESKDIENLEAAIYDISGRKVYYKNMPSTGAFKEQIEIGGLAQGSYVLILRSENEIIAREKLIVLN